MSRQLARIIGSASLNEAAGFQSVAASYCFPLLELSKLQRAGTATNNDENYNLVNASTKADPAIQNSSTDNISSGPWSSATAHHERGTAGQEILSCSGSKLHQPAKSQAIIGTEWMMWQNTCSSKSNNAAVISSRGHGSSGPFATARHFTTTNRQACSSAEHTADDLTLRIEIAADLQQLHQLLQQAVNSSNPLTAVQLATAYCQAVQLAAKQVTVAAVQPILDLLQPAWQQAVATASIQDIADALYSWAKLGYTNEELWSVTLAAVPALCKKADGQDLSNIAYAIAATAEANKGTVPGVSREEAEEVMRAVTHELVTIVQNTAAGQEDGRSASITNISTMRWAHETFEQLA